MEGGGCVFVGEEGEVGVRGEAAQADGVVGVFVGEEDGVDVIDGGVGKVFEHVVNAFACEAGVDEDLGLRGLDEGAVTAAAGAEDLEE